MRPNSSTPLALAAVPGLLALAPLAGAQSIKAEFFAQPFGLTTDIASIPGDTTRIFTTTRQGLIKIIGLPSGNNMGTYLDMSSLVDDGGEGGLLGLAFHPDYSNNGKFYVSYTTGTDQGDSIISQFSVSAGNANQADLASEQVIWGPLIQTTGGHKAGDIEFGPDGKLYYAIGDGYAFGGDPLGRAQNLLDPRGKILRFDVDLPYPHVPADNPFVGNPAGLDHIWALGFRNPFRLGIDQVTGDIYVGDVGQSGKEEVSYLPGGVPGMNLGWNCKEGTNCFGGCTMCNDAMFTDPVFEYANGAVGCAVMGGTVYRGSAIPSFYGYYILSDFCTEDVTTFKVVGGVATDVTVQPNMTPSSGSWNNVLAWGRDASGEIYVANYNAGQVFKIVEDCAPGNYCQSAPNSNGSGAIIGYSGSTSVSADDFVLEVAGAATSQFGIFYYGAGQIEIPFGDGFRCVSSPTFRLNPPILTDGAGGALLQLDYSSPPQQSGLITPGNTWNFQFWFRDPAAGGAGFNLSDGISAPFCP